MSNDSSNEISKYKQDNIIKYGLIPSNPKNINVKEIFTSYFKTLHEEKYKIKRENHYEFKTQNFPNLTISIVISTLEKILEIYSIFNFFILFIDMEDSKVTKFLDKTIDTIVSKGDNCFSKKFYILGFYSENKKVITKEKTTIIIEAKGIDYYFTEIKKDENMNNKFKNIIELIVNDSNTIMLEKFLDQKHSELIPDNSKSSCIIA